MTPPCGRPRVVGRKAHRSAPQERSHGETGDGNSADVDGGRSAGGAREVGESGESGGSFARSIGVVPQRLFWWRKRLEGERAGASGDVRKSATFAPVEVRPAELVALCAPVVVTTPAGVRIEIGEVDAATAAWVVTVLGGEGRS